MTHLKQWVAAVILTAVPAAALEACTARSTVDLARNSRDTAEYKVARDIATEMCDTEDFLKDETVIDSGTGTLLTEGSEYPSIFEGSSYRFTLTDRDTADLDLPSVRPHGRNADGSAATPSIPFPNASKFEFGNSTCTIRQHMRYHIKEWSDTLRSGDPLMRYYLEKFDWLNGWEQWEQDTMKLAAKHPKWVSPEILEALAARTSGVGSSPAPSEGQSDPTSIEVEEAAPQNVEETDVDPEQPPTLLNHAG